MPTISDLYDSGCFSEGQRNNILKRVEGALASHEDKTVVLQDSLGELAWSYSTGGISCGRSLRSLMLDEAIFLINSGLVEEAKEFISALLAMYHSPEYINEKGWFSFKVTITELHNVSHRIWLLTAAKVIGVNDMPEIAICTDKYILAMVDRSKSARREQRAKNKG